MDDDALSVDQIARGEIHVLTALLGDGQTVPDRVDVLRLELCLLGVPVDDLELGLNAKLSAYRLSELGVKADQLIGVLLVVVVHRIVQCDANNELLVALDVFPVGISAAGCKANHRSQQHHQCQRHCQNLFHCHNLLICSQF